jgi:hypothetical protein
MTCRDCRRPRATEADVKRWEAEFGEGDEASDAPPWASAICWHVGETRCYRRPIGRITRSA